MWEACRTEQGVRRSGVEKKEALVASTEKQSGFRGVTMAF